MLAFISHGTLITLLWACGISVVCGIGGLIILAITLVRSAMGAPHPFVTVAKNLGSSDSGTPPDEQWLGNPNNWKVEHTGDPAPPKVHTKKSRMWDWYLHRSVMYQLWRHRNPEQRVSCPDAQSLLLQAITALDQYVNQFDEPDAVAELRKLWKDLNDDQKISSVYDPPN